MIHVRLIGGLGNQLFQYATGFALARRRGVPLSVDASAFRTYALWPYRLDALCITAIVRDDLRIGRIARSPLRRLAAQAAHRLGAFPRPYFERGFAFDPDVIDLSDGVYLDGYWQSARYFADAGTALRDEFRFVAPPAEWARRYLDEITAGEAVSLHVRRGDYVSNAANAAKHGTCSPDYYRRAARRIAERCGREPVFYVFSDDLPWVREHMEIGFEMRFVDADAPGRELEDLRLMQSCRHHIIANSSFSWWGAWLNPQPDKVVVAPARWFADARIDCRDVYPPAWSVL